MSMKTFECTNCWNEFEAEGFANPAFYADTVDICPKCAHKSWEKLYKITKTEYERLKNKGVKVKLFN